MIFADTSYWVAPRNWRDDHHSEALSLLRLHSTVPLVTTNHVRGETWTVLRRRAGHRSAVEFLDALDESHRFDVVTVSPELEVESLQWLRRHDEREYSFVDATSFAIMTSLGITDAFAFDADFQAAGFRALRL